MNQQLYKKVGRKYIPVGYADGFTGFPAEGIWSVYRKDGYKTDSCIGYIGEFKKINYSKLASLIKDKEDSCLKALDLLFTGKKGYSRVDIVHTIFKTILSEEKQSNIQAKSWKDSTSVF